MTSYIDGTVNTKSPPPTTASVLTKRFTSNQDLENDSGAFMVMEESQNEKKLCRFVRSKSSTCFCKSANSVDSIVAHVHVVNGYKIRWIKWSIVSYLWMFFSFVVAIFVSDRVVVFFVAVYLYVNGSGSITSVGEERANLSADVYL